MKDTITVRKEHLKYLEEQFKPFGIDYKILNEYDGSFEVEVEFRVLQQFYGAASLSGLSQGFTHSEKYLKDILYLKPKPFSESELTQL